MIKHNSSFFIATLVLSAGAILNLPIVDLRWPFWDGSIIDLALQTNRYPAITSMFKEVGAPLAAAYYLTFGLFGDPTVVQQAVSLASVIVVGYSIYHICYRSFELSKSQSFLCSVVAISFPANFVYASSIMGFYGVCFAAFFASWAWILTKDLDRRKFISLPIVLIFASFSINSLMCVQYALIAVFLSTKSPISIGSRKFIYTLATIPFVFFVLKIMFLQPSGELYGAEKYNSIQILPTENMKHILGFFKYFFSIYAENMLRAAALLSLVGAIFIHTHRESRTNWKDLTRSIVIFFICIACAILPYALVLKHPSNSWQARHALLVGPMLSVGLASILRHIQWSNRLKLFGLALIATIVCCQTINLWTRYEFLYARRTLDKWLVDNLPADRDFIDSSCIYTWRFSTELKEELGSFEYRFYELNGITAMAYKSRNKLNITLNSGPLTKELIEKNVDSAYRNILNHDKREQTYLIDDFGSLNHKSVSCIALLVVEGSLYEPNSFKLTFKRI